MSVGSTMITEIQCRTYAAECERLGVARGISSRRATVLMAMAHSWNMLAGQKERYTAIVAEEDAPGDGGRRGIR
jgi:hypothetical protein